MCMIAWSCMGGGWSSTPRPPRVGVVLRRDWVRRSWCWWVLLPICGRNPNPRVLPHSSSWALPAPPPLLPPVSEHAVHQAAVHRRAVQQVVRHGEPTVHRLLPLSTRHLSRLSTGGSCCCLGVSMDRFVWFNAITRKQIRLLKRLKRLLM